MATIQKNQSYPDFGFAVDGRGIATDLTTGKSLSRGEVDQRIAGTGVGNIKHRRGGVAGSWDRNKQWALPAIEFGAAFLPGAGPLVSAGIGAAAKGVDRPGKSGIGFDPKAAAMGGVQGYGMGTLGNMAQGALAKALPGIAPAGASGAAAGPSLGAQGSGASNVANAAAGGGGGGGIASTIQGILGKIGGLPGVSSAANFLTGNGGLNALGTAQGINAALLQQKALDYAQKAEGTATGNWNANDPLRQAGRAGMLNPKSSVDTSALPGIRKAGNPFARMG